jgi:hypothetical protein
MSCFSAFARTNNRVCMVCCVVNLVPGAANKISRLNKAAKTPRLSLLSSTWWQHRNNFLERSHTSYQPSSPNTKWAHKHKHPRSPSDSLTSPPNYGTKFIPSWQPPRNLTSTSPLPTSHPTLISHTLYSLPAHKYTTSSDLSTSQPMHSL